MQNNVKNEERTLNIAGVADSNVSQTIDDEVLRQRIRDLISEPEPESLMTRFSTNPLVIMLVAFFLFGVIGLRLIDLYFSQQKRSTTYSSNSQNLDEITRIRVSKIGEVWAKAGLYETEMETAMQSAGTEPNKITTTEASAGDREKYDRVERLHAELLEALTNNRFWLGEKIHDGVRKYADVTHGAFLGFKTDQKFEELREKSRQARVELNQLRDKIFNGEIR
jgi:hypothetical protein